MMNNKPQLIPTAEAMLEFGQALAKRLQPGVVVFLHGDLGAGKTTLVRGILQGLGHQGKVKSPTFTVLEPYELEKMTVYHFDLYRLNDPEELELIGIRDYHRDDSLCIFEWPEKALGLLPKPDIHCYIEIVAQGRLIDLQGLG